MARADMDKTKPRAKDKDARAKVAERVNITAKEQGECRREGFEAAIRFVDAWHGNQEDLIEAVKAMIVERDRRWGLPSVSD